MLTRLINGETIVLTPEEEAEQRAEWDANSTPTPADIIRECKNYLAATDWVASKHMDHVLTQAQCDCTIKYADILSQRQEKRDKINSLE